MRKLALSFVFTLAFVIAAFCQTQRYVTSTGAGSHTGVDLANAWTITEAVSGATANMDIHIQKGTYSRAGQGLLTISSSGTSGNPTRWIGYDASPNDITATTWTTFVYGDNTDPTKYPVFTGDITSNFLEITGDYNEIHNIQITSFDQGIRVTGDNNLLKNCHSKDLGHPTVDTYDGWHYIVNGDNNELLSMYAENGNAQAYTIAGNNNHLQWIDLRSDNGTAQLDYGVVFSSPGYGITNVDMNNHLEDYRLFRYHNGAHKIHGIDCKGARGNLAERAYIYRSQVEMMFKTSYENEYRDIHLDESYVAINNGAHDNILKNFKMEGKGAYAGIRFGGFDDGASSDPNIDCPCGADDMTFVNFEMSGYQKAMSWGEGNSYSNLQFDGFFRFYNFSLDGDGQSMRFGIEGGTPGGATSHITQAVEFINLNYSNATATEFFNFEAGSTRTYTITNSNFFNNGFSAPSGTNIITQNPLFTDAANLDYTLQAASPLRNAGATTIYTYDLNNNSRPEGAAFDIGPYEYGASGATCSDGIQNQGETGVDCGGPCAPCSQPGSQTDPFFGFFIKN